MRTNLITTMAVPGQVVFIGMVTGCTEASDDSSDDAPATSQPESN